MKSFFLWLFPFYLRWPLHTSFLALPGDRYGSPNWGSNFLLNVVLGLNFVLARLINCHRLTWYVMFWRIYSSTLYRFNTLHIASCTRLDMISYLHVFAFSFYSSKERPETTRQWGTLGGFENSFTSIAVQFWRVWCKGGHTCPPSDPPSQFCNHFYTLEDR